MVRCIALLLAAQLALLLRCGNGFNFQNRITRVAVRKELRMSTVGLGLSKGVEFNSARPMKVLIAGGGIGGLILGKALESKGIDFEVFEKAKEYKPFGGPIQVQSNALSCLEAIDKKMCEEIMAAGTKTGNRINGLKDGISNKWYCKFDTGAPAQRRGLPLTRVVDRPDLQRISLKNLDPARVHVDSEVVSYDETGEGVVVTLSNGQTVQGDVLVGADGIWSAVRSQMFGNPRFKDGADYSGYTCFTGTCEHRPRDVKEVAYKVFLYAGKYFVCSDVGRGRMQWYAFVGQEPGKKDLGGLGPSEFLQNVYKGWSREVLDLIEATPDANIEQRDLYDRAPAMMQGWSRGKVAIMGDAAHPMMPNLGQGGCQAIEDAYRLAHELGKVPNSGSVPLALRKYERERVLRASAVHGLARIASDVLFYSELLFNNKYIGAFVGAMMTISMPFILEFLYQNVLDRSDWKFISERMSSKAAYEDDAESSYRTVAEAGRALRENEKLWAEMDKASI